MNKKNFMTKMILDTIMLITLTLLFRKDTFGMTFHEVAGLSIIGVFVIHLILNQKWIKAVTSNLFTKKTTVRAKISWIINASLVVCFALIGLSGVLMSKVLFHFNIEGNWKTLHYFCAALSIILVGVHLGMHGALIGHSIGRSCKKMPVKVSGMLIGIISLALVIFGAYNLKTTSFTRWISMPFTASSKAPEGIRYMQNKDASDSGQDADSAKPDQDSASVKNTDQENKTGVSMQHGKMQQSQTPAERIGTAFLTFIQCFSIMFVFAMITCMIDLLFMAKKHKLNHKIS